LKLSPRKMGQLARKNKIDAGPISLVDSFALEERFEPLADLGIAVKNSARSVLLFSKKRTGELSGCRIGITPHTVTSSELLRYILKSKYKVRAKFHTGFKGTDTARLLIGDQALQGSADRQLRKKFPYVMDLGEEWRRWKGLPFVFARWMVSKKLTPAQKRELAGMLKRNLLGYSADKAGAIHQFEKNKKWKHPSSKRYLQEFCYRFGRKEKRTIALFRRVVRNAPGMNR